MKIIIATHKNYWMPQDPCYLPVHVGCEGKTPIGYTGDNTGDNISLKNPNYCELTGVYWAWKNLKDEDYLGLVHYRRHFAKGASIFKKDKTEAVLKGDDFRALLKQADVILPAKRHYFIETIRSHYNHTQNPADLLTLEAVMMEKYPDYKESYEKVMNARSAHMFNIFVMKQELFSAYCDWMFDILFECEKRIDVTDYTPHYARVLGFLSELMLDVWIEKNKIKYVEQDVVNMDTLNWPRKIYIFLKNKIRGRVQFRREDAK